MSTYQPTYNTNNRFGRSPSSKVSYSPGHWKNYLVTDFVGHKDNRTSRDNMSNRALSPSSSINQIPYSNSDYFDEKQKKKE